MSEAKYKSGDDWATTFRKVRTEVLPALRTFGVHSVEAVKVPGARADAVALQLRDSRGMRVPRLNVSRSLLTRTEELVALLLAHLSEDDAVIRIGDDDF